MPHPQKNNNTAELQAEDPILWIISVYKLFVTLSSSPLVFANYTH